jgi:transposase InsO family protein
MDWASRRVLAWRPSNTLTTDFCLEAVQEAVTRYGPPDIFNTDQGSQFTSLEFTGLLKDYGIQISMDGIGCWRDNVFVERLVEERQIRGSVFAGLRQYQYSPSRLGTVPDVLQPEKTAPSA